MAIRVPPTGGANGWFCQTFGRETEPLPFGDEDAGLRVHPDESSADLLALYDRARGRCRRGDRRDRPGRAGQGVVRRAGDDAVATDPHDRGDGGGTQATQASSAS